MDPGPIIYEVYLKMAQTFCDRDRITWIDMHSNFKMPPIFKIAKNFKIGNFTAVKF